MIIGLVGGLVALLVLVHVVLQIFIFVRLAQLYRYKSVQKELAGAKTDVDVVLQDLRKLQSNLNVIEGVVKNHKITWAPKLNEISNQITRGVWLEELSWEGKTLTLRGSAVSKTGAEMIEINNFISNLKKDTIFNQGFSKIEAGTIKSHKVSNTAVADFNVTATVK